jgi:protein gp37
MKICALPHARWNPSPRSRRPTLAELFGEAPRGDALDLPLRWRDGFHIFVAPLYDLFAQDDAFVHAVFNVMGRAMHHEFQIETSHSDRLLALSPRLDWRSNIWVGVTVADQADLVRVDDLRRSGARVRFAHVVGPVAVGRRDLAEMDFVMVETLNAELHAGLEGACAVAGCRLFVGEPETAIERAMPSVGTMRALRGPGRGGRS